MGLEIYSSLSRTKETFTPLNGKNVNMYVCGPTVYDTAHLGHARTYINFDTIIRYLRHSGYDVLYVQNITDVGELTEVETGEDKIVKRAKERNIHPMMLSEIYTRMYFADMDALKVQRPDISPRASGHIPEQIEMVKKLIDKEYAYEVNGSVYFSVYKFPEYGKLSGRRGNRSDEYSRVDGDEKRHPSDFALWKRGVPESMLQWNSSWGWGYPGWHIECSAMSTKYLGNSFDIHGGGIDNIFPHHENEIAQSEAANGVPFAKYWVHNGSLTIDGKKMSKSLGNFVTIQDALLRHTSEEIRFYILSTHYRSPLDYSEEKLSASSKGLQRIQKTFLDLSRHLAGATETSEEIPQEIQAIQGRLEEEMNNDFNTVSAIAALFQFVGFVDQYLKGSPTKQAIRMAHGAMEIIGIKIFGILSESPPVTKVDQDPLIELLVQARSKLRALRQWDISDSIRDKLAGNGIILEDSEYSTTWRAE